MCIARKLNKIIEIVVCLSLHLPSYPAVDGSLLVLRPWLGINALELIENVRFFYRYFCLSPSTTEIED